MGGDRFRIYSMHEYIIGQKVHRDYGNGAEIRSYRGMSGSSYHGLVKEDQVRFVTTNLINRYQQGLLVLDELPIR